MKAQEAYKKAVENIKKSYTKKIEERFEKRLTYESFLEKINEAINTKSFSCNVVFSTNTVKYDKGETCSMERDKFLLGIKYSDKLNSIIKKLKEDGYLISISVKDYSTYENYQKTTQTDYVVTINYNLGES